MLVRPADLSRRLRAGLAPAYLVSGDDTLLVEEACEAVLEAARRSGFGERSVLFVDQSFNWHDVIQDAASMSLFAERRIVDVRVPSGKLGQDATDVLRRYAGRPPEDTLLLIRMPRLEPRENTKAWFKTLDGLGVVVQVWPINQRDLPRWLAGRVEQAGLSLTPDALNLLADRVEGNLLAAVQEVEKLKLAGLGSPISAESLMTVLEDAARYDAFELIDATLDGDGKRVSRMVRSLRQEGTGVLNILGALTSQLRRISEGSYVPQQRKRLIGTFLRRAGSAAAIDRILAECALVDAQAKGQLPGDAWMSLEDLMLRLAGVRAVAGGSAIRHLR